MISCALPSIFATSTLVGGPGSVYVMIKSRFKSTQCLYTYICRSLHFRHLVNKFFPFYKYIIIMYSVQYYLLQVLRC